MVPLAGVKTAEVTAEPGLHVGTLLSSLPVRESCQVFNLPLPVCEFGEYFLFLWGIFSFILDIKLSFLLIVLWGLR